MRAEALRRGIRQLQSESDSDEEMMGAEDDSFAKAQARVDPELNEYRVEMTDARVGLAGAKALLYHYCTKLPTDM